LVCVLGESSVRETRRRLTQAGIPVFRTPESAITAFSFMVQYVRNQQLLLETPSALSSYQPPDIAAATALCTAALERGQNSLSATESQRLLSAFHINTFPGIVANPANGHRQLSLHIHRDHCIGPVIELALGAPGRDLTPPGPVTFPPLNDRLIGDYFNQDAIARLLGATPTLPAVAQDPLRRLLLRISEIACELPWIESLKIDPLIADDYAVRPGSVQITLRQSPPPGSRYPHMAIRPYPVALETHWLDKKDQPYSIRPIRPEDAPAFQNFVRQLSHQSRYFRFFGAMRELPAMQLARHTQIDYDREMILVAVRKNEFNEEIIIGEAFYGVLEDERTCEFGVVIADHLSGFGIGSRIMNCLMNIARERGMQQMIGEVLAENEPMQGMMNALGFSVNLTDNPEIMELYYQL
jgi:acetyltransferase